MEQTAYTSYELSKRIGELEVGQNRGLNPWDMVNLNSELDKRALYCLYKIVPYLKDDSDSEPAERRQIQEPVLGSPAYTAKLRHMK